MSAASQVDRSDSQRRDRIAFPQRVATRPKARLGVDSVLSVPSAQPLNESADENKRADESEFRIRLAARPQARPSRGKRNTPLRSCRAGFTLVEVLAALLLMAIVLPATMQAISLATQASSNARHRTEAAGLAEGKLNELVATGEWQDGSLSGNFGGDFANYNWTATVNGWDQDTSGQSIQEIDLVVSWNSANHNQSLTLSTLVYVRAS